MRITKSSQEKNKKKNYKKVLQKVKRQIQGITLIALVVTIIILLILAGIAIASLTGDNGLFARARQAREETLTAQEDELRNLTILEAATHLEKYEFEDESGKKVKIPEQCAVSQVEGENTLANGLVIIDVNGNEWVWVEVPESAMPAGLTFENEEDYTTLETALQKYTADYRDPNYTDTWYSSCGLEEGEYAILKQEMLESVYNNLGFYIGRYEVGIKESTNRNFGLENSIEHPTTETPVIQQNKYPYNWVTQRQAQNLSEQLAIGEKTSCLMFGIQWDMVLKYLESNGVSMPDLKENSSSLGNYADSEFEITKGNYSENWGSKFDEVKDRYLKVKDKFVLLTTGATERNAKMNIFDFSGNVFERTLENSNVTNFKSTYRGGSYGYTGLDKSASSRTYNFSNFNDSGFGFRPSLC